MKRITAALFTTAAIIGLTGANNNTPTRAIAAFDAPQKKPCYGYTIIEFGKGVDCNGDTIRLVKVPGGQALPGAATLIAGD